MRKIFPRTKIRKTFFGMIGSIKQQFLCFCFWIYFNSRVSPLEMIFLELLTFSLLSALIYKFKIPDGYFLAPNFSHLSQFFVLLCLWIESIAFLFPTQSNKPGPIIPCFILLYSLSSCFKYTLKQQCQCPEYTYLHCHFVIQYLYILFLCLCLYINIVNWDVQFHARI